MSTLSFKLTVLLLELPAELPGSTAPLLTVSSQALAVSCTCQGAEHLQPKP